MVYWWQKVFRDGRKSLSSQPKNGRPASQITEVNVNTISVMIREDQHLNFKALEELTNISKSTIHRILMESLGMRLVLSTNTFFCRVPLTCFT